MYPVAVRLRRGGLNVVHASEVGLKGHGERIASFSLTVTMS